MGEGVQHLLSWRSKWKGRGNPKRDRCILPLVLASEEAFRWIGDTARLVAAIEPCQELWPGRRIKGAAIYSLQLYLRPLKCQHMPCCRASAVDRISLVGSLQSKVQLSRQTESWTCHPLHAKYVLFHWAKGPPLWKWINYGDCTRY